MTFRLDERGSPDRRPDEPVEDAPRSEGDKASSRVTRQRRDAVYPGVLELVALGEGERLAPEARLQRQNRDVDPVAIERSDTPLWLVRQQIELEGALGRRQDGAFERRRVRPCAERVDERGRPEVLVDVVGRRQGSIPPATSATRVSMSGSGSPAATNGTNPRTAACACAVPVPRVSPRRSQA